MVWDERVVVGAGDMVRDHGVLRAGEGTAQDGLDLSLQ